MLPRSAGKPILMSLGAAAIIAAGAVPVLAAPSLVPPEVPETVTVDEKEPAVIESSIEPVDETGFQGMTVKATLGEAAVSLNIDCPGDIAPSDNTCDLGGIEGSAQQKIIYTVKATGDVKENVDVTLTVTVTRKIGDAPAESSSAPTAITFRNVDPSPSPTPTPTKTSAKPTPTQSSSGSNNGGGNSNSGGGSGSGGGGGSSTPPPPAPNASLGTPQNPQVNLPPVPPMNPSVAPQQSPVPVNRLQNNKAPVAQDLTFERMASTQIAWLAALLVAFSLLLTQLRLGRRRNVPVRVLTATGRPAGSHRRPRRGMFSK